MHWNLYQTKTKEIGSLKATKWSQALHNRIKGHLWHYWTPLVKPTLIDTEKSVTLLIASGCGRRSLNTHEDVAKRMATVFPSNSCIVTFGSRVLPSFISSCRAGWARLKSKDISSRHSEWPQHFLHNIQVIGNKRVTLKLIHTKTNVY